MGFIHPANEGVGTQGELVMTAAEGVLETQNPETRTKHSRLADRLQRRLHNACYPALAGVRVDERDGCIVICGQVHSDYYKQLAQSIAMRSDGVDTLTNEIEVGNVYGIPPIHKAR